jgi:hypothetical protein
MDTPAVTVLHVAAHRTHQRAEKLGLFQLYLPIADGTRLSATSAAAG